jgi:hypothetical protein
VFSRGAKRQRAGSSRTEPAPKRGPDPDTSAGQREAIRDILHLYFDLTDFCALHEDAARGSFDPWTWLQCEPDHRDGYAWRSCDEALLLRQGSAVALLCGLLEEWSQGRPDRELWRAALEAGRFDHLPEARRVVEAGLSDDPALVGEPQLATVYDEYVLAFFEMLAREARPRQRVPVQSRPRSSFRDAR